jgi:uncharacterized protein YndB with AHSA1/START domain
MTVTPHRLDRDLDLELDREVDVPADLVWRAWTTPELVTQWFAPKPYETSHCEIDLRPGGRFHTVMRSPEGEENANTGCYLEVVPNERLVWTTALGPGFRPHAADLAMTVVLELTPTGSGGTRYRAVVLHGAPEDAKQHADMGFAEGWGAALDQLVAVARTL